MHGAQFNTASRRLRTTATKQGGTFNLFWCQTLRPYVSAPCTQYDGSTSVITRGHAPSESGGSRRPIRAGTERKTLTHRDVSGRLSTAAFNQGLITNCLTPPCSFVFVSPECIGACHTRLSSLTHRRARRAHIHWTTRGNFHFKRCRWLRQWSAHFKPSAERLRTWLFIMVVVPNGSYGAFSVLSFGDSREPNVM